jgi:hypothetical protein
MQGVAIRVGHQHATAMPAIQHEMSRGLFSNPSTCRFPPVFIDVINRKMQGLRMLQRALNVHGEIWLNPKGIEFLEGTDRCGIFDR